MTVPSLAHAPELLSYIAKAHERTRRVVVLIPRDEYDWAPKHGWFSLGDLVRHLAGIERWMYAENASGRPSRYPGHGRDLADGHDATLAYYDRLHAESYAIFARLDDAALARKVATPAGAPITLWKWLRAMVEHEAHHRGQLYLMLALRDVPTPPIYGLTAEEVLARSVRE
jgi:uncharacterized damage-inducible protein DinB